MTLDHTTIPDNNDSLQPKDESTTTEENGAIHYKNIYPVIVYSGYRSGILCMGAAYFLLESHTLYRSDIHVIRDSTLYDNHRLTTTTDENGKNY